MFGMSGDPEKYDSTRVGTRRSLRHQRSRASRITMRHRWYAGAIASVLSGALVFAGVTPALADVMPPPSDSAESVAPAAESPVEEAPVEDAPAEEPPVEEAPIEEAPAPEAPVEELPAEDVQASRLVAEGQDAGGDAAISPLSIPDPTPVANGSTTLRVQKFGARNAAGLPQPLGGATFAAYPSTRGGARTGTPVATCTTVAGTGQCEMVVPNRSSGSGGAGTQGYWVYETAAPAGFDPVGNVGLGAYDGGKTSTPYSVFTNGVSGSSTIHLIPEDATAYVGGGTGSTTKTASNGFANVRENASFPADCGLSIAIIFDTSTSINSTEMSSMKSAALNFVGNAGLGGTPSQVALYRFSTTASKMLNLTSIAANQTAVNASINSLPASGDGYTNWDDAMRKVAFNGSETYDVVLFLTDGDPTVNGTAGSNEETDIGFRNIEEGIFSANAVKNMTGPAGARTKIVAVGIGLASGSDLNLRAVSGPVANEDYYTTNFAGLSTKLHEIALANCGGSVSVVKKTVDANGNVIENLAGGWTFTGSTSGAWIKRDGQSNVASLALTTPSTGISQGAVNFPIDLTGVTSRTLTITETVNNGYTPDSVTCTGATPTGTAASFSIPVTQNSIISCTVVNKQAVGKLTLVKQVDNGNTGATTAPTAWTLSATGPTAGVSGATGSANVTNKSVLTGDYTLGETGGPAGYSAGAWSCTGGTLTGSTVKVLKDANVVCTIKNTAIEPKITLKKIVENGSTGGAAQPTAWTLNAAAGSSAQTPGVTGPMGNAAVTAKAVKIGQYNLSESGGPSGYTSTGAWACANAGTGSFTSTATSVTLNPGNDITCTIVNTAVAPKLTLKKNVDNKNGIGTHGATEWALTAGGAAGWTGTTTGSAASASTAKQTVQANMPYTLGETGPTGYDASAWTCDSNIAVSAGKITLPLGADVTCQITNTVKTANVTLVKKWVSAIQGDQATITAGSTSDTSTANGAATFTDTSNQVTVTVAQGSTVNLTETLAGGNAGSYGTTFACTSGSVTGSGKSYTLTVPTTDVTCTYTNTADTVTVSFTKNWAGDAFAGDSAGLTITRGAATLASGTATAPAPQTINATVRVGDVVKLAEVMGDNTGAYGQSWACTGATAPAPDSLATASITVPAGGLSCTVTNTPKKITVRVDKQWVNAFTGDDATITVNGTPGESQADAGNEIDANVVVKQIRIGDTVAISESVPGANVGEYDAQYKCGTASFTNGTSIPSFTATADVTCVFKNTARTHRIVLEKQWVNAVQGDHATLAVNGGTGVVSTANGNSGSWLDPVNRATATVRAGDTVLLAETLSALSGSEYDSSISCTPTVATTPGQGASVSLVMPDAGVVCTFTNSNIRGKITLRKTVVNDNGGGALDTAWTLNAAGIVSASGVEGAAAVTNRFVPAGSYALTETNGPAGYLQANLACTGGAFTAAANGNPASVQVSAGAEVICTFTNDDVAPTLTLKKNVVNTGGGTSAATDWELTAAGSTTPWNPETTGGPATSVTATQSVTAGVAYTLSEDGPGGYQAGSWTCDAQGVVNAGIVTLGLGQNVTCQITNTAIPATGEHTKRVTSISQGSDGLWTIVYEIVVRNTSLTSTLTYDLADQLQYGSDIDVQSASWAGPDGGSPVAFTDTATWSTQLVDGATLPQNAAGDATDVYTVTVRAAIPAFPADDDSWHECATPVGSDEGGFLNESALTIGRSTVEAIACDDPEFPDIAKSASAPTQDAATGDWTIEYTIDVTTTGDAAAGDPAVYAVVDENLPSAPAGWSLVGGTWTIASSPRTPALALSVAPGAHEIFAGHIPAGSDHAYTVTGMLRPTADAGPIELCSQDGGLVNGVVVTSGEAWTDAEACVDVDVPTVSVMKDAKSVRQNADGTWLITYLVSVTNDSSERVAVYDLEDAPLFGTDATPDEVRWAPSNAAGEFDPADLTDSTPLADDKLLPPHAGQAGVDHYVVQVTATVDPEAWTGDEGEVLSLPCPRGWEQNDSADGGFLNAATATAGGESDTDHGCTEPNLPTIEKTPGGAVQQTDPSQWAVTFNLTVTGQGADTFYDLADVPDFVDGVELISGSATLDGAEPVTVPLPVDGGEPMPFVDGVALGGSEVHEWVVTWIVDVPARILPPELRECTEQGGGFDNRALLTVGDVVQTADACIPVDDKVYPDMTKKVVGLSRDAVTRIWEITYRIEVTLSDSEDTDGEGNSLNPKNLSSEYGLVEELQFGGIDVVDAAWIGHDSGTFGAGLTTATLADAEPIAAGATHTYTVVVHATLAPGDLQGHTVGCQAFGQERSVGFFNVATLSFTDDLPPVVREACTPPIYPTVEKTPGTVTEDPETGLQRVEYFVQVTSPAPVVDQPVTNVIYALTETPDALPSGVSLVGDWHAEKVGEDTPTPSAASWNGVGAWNLQAIAGFTAADRLAGKLVHTYRVWADVEVTAIPEDELEPCSEGDSGGIPIWNTVTLGIGEQSVSDDACVEVDFDDVGIEKTSVLPGEATSVEPGDTFEYVLTVTNHGTRPAEDVRVTDADISERLDILGLTVSPAMAWSVAPGYTEEPNNVDLTLDSLEAGASATITIEVEFLPVEPVLVDHDEDPETPPIIPPVVGDDELPLAPDPLESLENTACVSTVADPIGGDRDGEPYAVNCDDEEIPTRDIAAMVYTRCVNDAPFLGWVVTKSASLIDEEIELEWHPENPDVTPETSPASITHTQPGGTTSWSREIAWPGAAFTPSGISIDYPGWRPITAADIASPTEYFLPGTNVVMTPAEQAQFVFNGLILDPSELDFAWRGNTEITISVNPELTFSTGYPPATPACFVARHTELQIEKTASVQRAERGGTHTYDLAVANVSDDSAAEGVVVTDVIPGDLRVTDITWPGEGDDSVFPNWETCEVTGQDGAGFGGTLECVLFGPLQPQGADNGGASAAPTITLSATVHARTTANVITNVAVVDYHTFGDPEDVGRDADDATVLLSSLPATGSAPTLPLAMLGLIALLAGATALMVKRRRRGEVGPKL